MTGLRVAAVVAAAALALTACTNSSTTAASTTAAATERGRHQRRGQSASGAAAPASGEKITHRLLRPGRRSRLDGLDHQVGAVAEAEALGDVELVVAEGTNDVNLQISQVETFINDKVDAIVLLPFDGAAMTDVAHQGDGRRHPGHQCRP